MRNLRRQPPSSVITSCSEQKVLFKIPKKLIKRQTLVEIKDLRGSFAILIIITVISRLGAAAEKTDNLIVETKPDVPMPTHLNSNIVFFIKTALYIPQISP